jgi:hypothetical protein
MCEPTTMALASFAIGATQAVVGYSAQKKASDEAYTEQTRVYNENQRNALLAFGDQQAASNQRIAQEQDAAAADSMDVSLEARANRARNMVAAGEAGVSGPTVDSLMRDIYGKEGRSLSRIDTNLDWSTQQLEAEKTGQTHQTVSRINSVARAKKNDPSLLATGLQIGTAGVNAYSGYKSNTRIK